MLIDYEKKVSNIKNEIQSNGKRRMSFTKQVGNMNRK